MNNLAGRVAAFEVFPGIVFSFEFLDPAIFEHYSPTPKSDKPAVNGLVYSGWVLKFVSHDAPHCSHTPLAGFRFGPEGRLSAALALPGQPQRWRQRLSLHHRSLFLLDCPHVTAGTTLNGM